MASRTPTIRLDIQREDVGTLLRIKPLLSNEGNLRLELLVENQLVIPLGDPETGPVIANRSIETSFSAGFGQRMVIAGLNSESDRTIETRVPFLSAIPVLGQLFTAKLDLKRKTYFVLTVEAHLIPTTEEKQATNEALVRAVARIDPKVSSHPGARYALRAASYYTYETAEAVAKDLDVAPWPTVISHRATDDGDRFDLFVIGFPDLPDLAKIAITLEKAGLVPEIVTLADAGSTVR